jgi:hypothetical protein
MGPIHGLQDWPVSRLEGGRNFSYICQSGHSSGAKFWVCDPGLALLTQRRPHSVPRTGLEPVSPACKAGVLTRLDYRG